ncbi:MAG: NHL repeat-containing protein [Cyclobacteriaceae bacterium]
MKVNLCFLICVLLLSCSSKKEWVFSDKIILPEDVHPLGLTMVGTQLWISDPDNNRILLVNNQGAVLDSTSNLARPMHITSKEGIVYVPNFTSDTITIFSDKRMESIQINESLDAPASVAVQGETMAIADFYNHRVLLIEDGNSIHIGGEGRTDGFLYYPTDVALTEELVVVADAYNNRVQVFDRKGQFIRVIGWQENIQVATGIEVYENQILVSDFYGGRVLIYDFDGNLVRTLSDHFNKPTDVLVAKDKMFVANYGENALIRLNFE